MPWAVPPAEVSRKPLGAVRPNWEHPINRKLYKGYLFDKAIMSSMYQGDEVSIGYGAYVYSVNGGLDGFRSRSADDSLNAIQTGAVAQHGGDITYHLVLYAQTVPSGNQSDLVTFYESADPGTYDKSVYWSNEGWFGYYEYTGAVRKLPSSVSVSAGNVYNIVAGKREGKMFISVNRVTDESGTAYGSSYTGFSTPKIRIGSRNNTAASNAGVVISTLSIFKTGLTASECLSLTNFPYGTPDNPRFL